MSVPKPVETAELTTIIDNLVGRERDGVWKKDDCLTAYLKHRRRFCSYAQDAKRITDADWRRATAGKNSTPDVISKTEFKRVTSSTLPTSLLTFINLKPIPFD